MITRYYWSFHFFCCRFMHSNVNVQTFITGAAAVIHRDLYSFRVTTITNRIETMIDPSEFLSSLQLMAIVTRSINGSINYVHHSVRLRMLELGYIYRYYGGTDLKNCVIIISVFFVLFFCAKKKNKPTNHPVNEFGILLFLAVCVFFVHVRISHRSANYKSVVFALNESVVLVIFTWFLKVMDIHISGMFLNLNQLNRRVHWDGIRHNVLLVHLPMLWQPRNVVDSDHFDDESAIWRRKKETGEQKFVNLNG